MSFGSPPAKPKPRGKRGRLPSKADVARARWATVLPAPATPANVGLSDDPYAYACPDGACCGDPECTAENRKRGVIR